VEVLSEIHSMGKCEIGAHLHPWNTPPLEEDLSARASMLKNLPYELQMRKLKTLTNQIEKAFGIKPQSFRAGRWGLSSEAVRALVNCGYSIDTSITLTISWEAEGDGPVYTNAETEPYLLEAENIQKDDDEAIRTIVEIPVSIGFNKWPFEFWHNFHLRLKKDWLKHLHLVRILHRAGLLRKIWLSPGMSSSNDVIALSNMMIRHGKRFLNLSFHSNSLLPGKGPFVRNRKELESFYSRLEKVLSYLTSTHNVVPLTLSEASGLFEREEMPVLAL